VISLSRAAAFLRDRLIFAKLAALILWVCYAGSIALGDGTGTFNLKNELVCADHLAFYTAARLVREGHADRVYDYPFVEGYQHDLFPEQWHSLEAFRNPPFYALLYYPTAGWSYRASAWFWGAVSLGSLAAGVWWLVRGLRVREEGRVPTLEGAARVSAPDGATVLSQGRKPLERSGEKSESPGGATVGGSVAPPGLADRGVSDQGLAPLANDGRPSGAETRDGAEAVRVGEVDNRGQPSDRPQSHPPGKKETPARLTYPRALGWVLTFYPVFCALSYGQNTLLSLGVFAATFRLLAAGRPFAAGLVAGLLWFKPPLLLGLVVWGLLDFRRLWPAAAGAVVTGAALTLGTYPVVPEAWAGFVGTLTGNVGFQNFEQWKMHNPIAFWRLLLPGLDDRWRWALAAACSAAAVGLFVRLWWARRDDLPAVFGGAVFLTLLASPHALIYEWALLAVAGVLWWPAARRDPDRWLLVYAVVWVTMFVSTHFTELQLKLFPAAVQVSVPVLGWAFWRSVRLLRAGRTVGEG